MKNEPIIAYNHLQEEQEESSHSMNETHSETKRSWRLLLNPVVVVIEIAAIVGMAIFMIQEMFK